MISFGTKYWLILLLAILAATIGIVFVLYFRNKENNDLSKIQIRILSILRFLSFFLVAFLLLSPFIKSLKKIIQKPLIIAAWDNSSSILNNSDSMQIKSQFAEFQNKIKQELGSEYSVTNYLFGEEILAESNFNFEGKKSDYSNLITKINENHFNENIGALILVGDGIYNQGKNPVNLVNEINYPVYAVAFGDTSEILDSRIENILVNRTAFSGNRFPAEVEIRFSKLKGVPLKLSVNNGNSEIESVIITPPNNDYFVSQQFILEAGNAGLKHFSAKIENVENERNTKNNSSEFVVNVLENKQKILFLSDGYHPDIGALKNTLELQKTYDVAVFTDEPYPVNLNDFNLIVLNQLPTAGKSVSEIIEKARNNRIPILFMVGNKTFLPQFNALVNGVKIIPLSGSAQEEAQATFNTTYATFLLSEDFKETLKRFPPLQVSFADYEIAPEIKTLFYQKIKNIETAKPIIATGTINGIKTGFIFGEGIWRWRLYDYLFNQNQTRFNELTNQLIQYLALRENEDNFMIDFNAVYTEIDDVILKAEVYNDAFEAVKSEEISINIKNEVGEEYNLIFDAKEENYILNAGHLPTGDYSFTAEVTIGSDTFTEKGKFTVVKVNMEDIENRANHQVLFQLANLTGGEFFLPGETNALLDNINNTKLKSISYFQEMINELLNLRWIFFVLLILLSVEWFLRKYWGIY